MKRVNFVSAAVAALMMAQVTPALATDVQPGDYGWVGDGRTLLITYAQHQRSKNFDFAGVGDVADSEMKANVLILRAVHYRELGGQKFAFHAIAPMGQFDRVKIGGASQSKKDGFGDLILGATWFPVTSEAATGTTLGLSTFVTAPTGVFDAARVSFGSGTWSVTPQVGLVQGLGQGFFLDAAAEATLYRDFDKAGIAFSRDNSTQVQAYVRYQWDEATAFSLGYTSKTGGALFADGLFQGQKTRQEQVRLVASTFVTPTQQLQVMIGKDTDVKGGFKSEPLFQIRLTSVF